MKLEQAGTCGECRGRCEGVELNHRETGADENPIRKLTQLLKLEVIKAYGDSNEDERERE